MKTDEMRQRIARQAEGDALSIHAENQRRARADVDLR